MGGVSGGGVGHHVNLSLQLHQSRENIVQQHSDGPLQIRVTSHGGALWSAGCVLVLLGEHFDVAPAQLQDLLPELGAALVPRLLDGVAQQHESPGQPEHQEQHTELLGHVPPQERRQHGTGAGAGGVEAAGMEG